MMYSVLGWIIDTIDNFILRGKLLNRGFLIGPYCPIYGVGVLSIIYFLQRYTNNILKVFVLSIFICMIVEYFTSYLLEKLFDARWWDYSNFKYNLNGRICLDITIQFGIGSVIVMYLVHPLFIKILDSLSSNTIMILGISILIIFIIDIIISFFIISKIKKLVTNKCEDDTEEINEKIKEYLKKKSPLIKRLLEAFPNARIRVTKVKNKLEDKRNEVAKKIKEKKKI